MLETFAFKFEIFFGWLRMEKNAHSLFQILVHALFLSNFLETRSCSLGSGEALGWGSEALEGAQVLTGDPERLPFMCLWTRCGEPGEQPPQPKHSAWGYWSPVFLLLS